MLLKKLAILANKLDVMGYYDEAKKIDKILKKLAAATSCGCSCSECQYAQDLSDMGRLRPAQSHHNNCGKCRMAKK